MRILSADDVRRAVTMPAAIDAVASAFVQLSTGRATVPLRAHLQQHTHESHTFVMPALLEESSGLGLKVVSVFPHNAARHNLPVIHALVVVLDAATGQPAAVLDGSYLTALRTGAASGAATRALARHDARLLAIIGAGAQAYHQVEAVCTVRPIKRVIIVNRSRERAERLAAMLRERAIAPHIDIAASSAEALAQADVICCATSSPTPVFDDASLRPGVHINGIGSFTPQMVEVPPETVGRAYVVVDQHTAAWAEAGDLQHARGLGLLDESQTVELGAVIAGIVPARTSDDQITFFKSVGNAVQDIAVAQLALREAERLNLGIDIDL